MPESATDEHVDDAPRVVSSASACAGILTEPKQRAVQSYLRILGPALRRQYGRLDHYTPALVLEVVLDLSLSVDYVCWAYLMFCSEKDFSAIHEDEREACDREAMRRVVATSFFAGDLTFDAIELAGALSDGTLEAVASGAAEASEGVSSLLNVLDW